MVFFNSFRLQRNWVRNITESTLQDVGMLATCRIVINQANFGKSSFWSPLMVLEMGDVLHWNSLFPDSIFYDMRYMESPHRMLFICDLRHYSRPYNFQ